MKVLLVYGTDLVMKALAGRHLRSHEVRVIAGRQTAIDILNKDEMFEAVVVSQGLASPNGCDVLAVSKVMNPRAKTLLVASNHERSITNAAKKLGIDGICTHDKIGEMLTSIGINEAECVHSLVA